MNRTGYYRQPSIAGDYLVFVCEDDLWSWQHGELRARRLTAGRGEVSTPRLSPDGTLLAFISREEGHPEVTLMDAEGGPTRRLTYLGSEVCQVTTWTKDGRQIVFSSDAHSAFGRDSSAFTISRDGGIPQHLRLGSLRSLSYGSKGTVIGRNADDPARWKRYRGGTAGDLWIDAAGDGEFKRLITLAGNLVSPMWIGERIYFLSDHEGIGNIYSCTPQGDDVRRHTDEREYFARFPSTDTKSIVYTAGGAIRRLDIATNTIEHLEIFAPSGQTQAARRFVAGGEMLESLTPSPNGEHVAVTSRGQGFTMPLWEAGVLHHAGGGSVRARLLTWLHDGTRLAYVSDANGDEHLEIKPFSGGDSLIISDESIGRVTELIASPTDDVLAFSNHRHELGIVDLATRTVRVVDRSPAARLRDIAFSPDGRYVAYAIATATPPAIPNPDCSLIRIVEVASGTLHDVTPLLRTDRCPAWDPEGKYLFFLSTRDFNPVYDALQFDLSFPQATRPFVITLDVATTSPFVPKPAPIYRDDKDDKTEANEKGSSDSEHDNDDNTGNGEKDNDKDDTPRITPVVITFEGIKGRILGFPVEEGDYGQIVAAKGRVLFTRFPLQGIKPVPRGWDEDERGGMLLAYDFTNQRSASIASDVSEIVLGYDHRTLIYQSEGRARVIDASTDLPEDEPAAGDDAEPGRKTGWLDLQRISLEVFPAQEWSQMYHEAWRLQRDQFWSADMSSIDWELVRRRYARLLPLLRTRSELSDLIWEMQGELGTSHAYEIGGDYRQPPQYRRGYLGASLDYDSATHRYAISKILRGDSWERSVDSPLAAPGTDVREGDWIVAIGNRRFTAHYTIDEALVNTAGKEISITIARGNHNAQEAATINEHVIMVRTLRDERPLRYRAWVEANRALVHERTGGRVGYLHIPDMGPWGFSEFHRGYLNECNRAGLIVDARHNRGGHISPLLLEKLARKRVGYDVPRYGPPIPYPPESVSGPMVALTDQFAGSDGDIFSHCFKLYQLGPLVGKRTWGGVIGISPSHELVDGTVTTQPEYSFWFRDVGWGVENYGTDPDHDVDIAPQDAQRDYDPQLEKALDLLTTTLASIPQEPLQFTPRPNLALPE